MHIWYYSKFTGDTNKNDARSVQIRSFFWSVFSCIRTGKNSVFGHFSRSERNLEYFLMKCEFHFQSLTDDGGLQMYSDKCCSIYFVVLTLMTCKCFFKSLCSWETHVSLFKKITVMNSTIFIYKPSLSWF